MTRIPLALEQHPCPTNVRWMVAPQSVVSALALHGLLVDGMGGLRWRVPHGKRRPPQRAHTTTTQAELPMRRGQGDSLVSGSCPDWQALPPECAESASCHARAGTCYEKSTPLRSLPVSANSDFEVCAGSEWNLNPLPACGPLDLGPVCDEVHPEAVHRVEGVEAFLDAAPPDRERDGGLDRRSICEGIGKRCVVFDVTVAHIQ